MKTIRRAAVYTLAILLAGSAFAQAPAPNAPAKELFGKKGDAAPLKARAIGFYSKGCLAGGVALPVNGSAWQVMRLSRNRNWGHPDLIAFLERFALKVPKVAGWNGILVGDLAQPRGGPMLTGHASHQVGLDADIWLTPMPNRTLNNEEREIFPAATDGARGPQRHRSENLHAGPCAGDPRRGGRPGSRAHFRERCDQESAMPRSAEHGLDVEGARLLGPRLSHACPDALSERQSGLHAASASRQRRRLRQGARLLVSRRILYPPPPKVKPKPKPPITMAELPPSCRDVLIAK